MKQAGFEGRQLIPRDAFEDWMVDLEERSCELDSAFQEESFHTARDGAVRAFRPTEGMPQGPDHELKAIAARRVARE